MLTEKRKANREAMAAEIAKLWTGDGFTCEWSLGGSYDKRRLTLHLTGPRGIGLYLSFDGGSRQPGVYVLSWHMATDSTAKLTGIFDSVNQYHRQKATDTAHGFDDLKEVLARRIGQLQDGSAFL